MILFGKGNLRDLDVQGAGEFGPDEDEIMTVDRE